MLIFMVDRTVTRRVKEDSDNTLGRSVLGDLKWRLHVIEYVINSEDC